jgi:transposase InsO family protein
MPFQERSTMSLKTEFVILADRPDANLSALCRRFGISRPTGYLWVQRYREQGVAGLAERPRRPQTSPRQTPDAMEALVLEVRDAHPTWSGRKIRRRLQDLGHAAVPAASTCAAILRRHDRLAPTAGHPVAWQRFCQATPNALWQMDFKGHLPLARGPGRCHPLTVLDDHSRFLLGFIACANEQDATVRAALTALFRRYGLPWRILTDNGPPWGNAHPTQRYTALSYWLIRLGVAVSHGRPLHPQTQGKAERFHRTVTSELLATTPLPDLVQAQQRFDAWRDTYNLERPHDALDLATPGSRYHPSPRPLPDPVPPIVYGPDDLVRTVHGGGQIQFRRRHYFVSGALGGQPVALRPTTTDGVFTVHYCHLHLGVLDLGADRLVLAHHDPAGDEELAAV